MNDGQKDLALPKSVISYLIDPATRAGVDALVAVEADSLPPEIEWNELGDYFAARAVAELTRAELAVALHAIWLAVWEPVIPKTWKMPSPEDLDEAGEGVSTGVIWDEKAFYVYHERGARALYTLVGLERRRLVVAFSLEQRDKPQITGELDGFTWRDDGHWGAWMLLTEGIVPNAAGKLELAALKTAAAVAMAAIEANPEPPKRKPSSSSAKRPPARTGAGKRRG